MQQSEMQQPEMQNHRRNAGIADVGIRTYHQNAGTTKIDERNHQGVGLGKMQTRTKTMDQPLATNKIG